MEKEWKKLMDLEAVALDEMMDQEDVIKMCEQQAKMFILVQCEPSATKSIAG